MKSDFNEQEIGALLANSPSGVSYLVNILFERIRELEERVEKLEKPAASGE